MALTHTQDATLGGDTAPVQRTSQPVDKDRYEVIDEVGEGGIGRVMRAHDRRLNRQVAIKLLRKLSAEHEQRFFAEAELTARLEHPAIVPVHDVGRWHSGEPFYAMKLVTGDSLKDVVRRAGSVDERLKLLPNVLTVCDAVAYAHSQGVIHRDLKPSNVMVGSFGETVVIDWGLARHGQDPADPRSIVGTPHYMAPEQARGLAADARSDVYALGALLYEVLGGLAPFESESDVLGKVALEAPRPLPVAVPGELVAIAGKAMQKAPADRYLDARALGADLRRYLEGQLVAAHRYSAWQRVVRLAARNKPLTLALVLLAVGAAYSFGRIVAERDAARAAELRAETAHVGAETARASAESRRDQLLYAQAKLWLEKDPTVAFAWLKSFAATKSATPRAVSRIAADAVSRGVATQRVQGRKRTVLSPDGRTLAGVSGDQLVLWTIDRATARPLGKTVGKVGALRFSVDGRSLYSAEGSLLREWSLDGKAEPRTLFEAPEAISGVLTSGSELFVGGELLGAVWRRDGDRFVKVAQRKSRIDHLQLEADLLLSHDVDGNFALQRLGDGNLLLSGLGEGSSLRDGRVSWGDGAGLVTLFDAKTGKRQTFAKEHEGQVTATVLGPGGRYLLSMGQDHALVVRDLKAGTRRAFVAGDAWLLKGELSEDGTQLLTLGQDHAARVWDLETGTQWVLKGHGAPFRTWGFTKTHVVTGDAEGEVRVWRRPRPKARTLLDAHASQYEEARGLPDGRVVSAGEDGALNVWNPVTGERLALKETGSGGSITVAGGRLVNGGGGGTWVRALDALPAPPLALEGVGEVHQQVLTKDGARLAVACADHTIRVFDLPSTKGRVVGSHDAAAWHVSFSPDGQWLASAGDDLPIRVWPLSGGSPHTLEGPEAITYDLQFSPDGRWVAAVGLDTMLHLWAVPSFEHRALRGHRGIVRALAFSADGARIVTVSDDLTARIWSLADPAAAPLVLEHAEQLAAAVFAADGKTLVTADAGGIWTWRVATGELLSVDREHTATVSGLALSADGQAVISAAEDHSVRWWPAFFGAAEVPDVERYSSIELRDDVAASRE